MLAWRRSLAWTLAAAAGAALALAQVLPWYAGAEPAASPGGAVRLLVSNVRQGNKRHEGLERLVAAEDPDVIGLVEVNSRWREALGALRARYPHHYELPDERYVGLGLYSRLPLEDARVLRLPDATPALAATLATSCGEVRLVLVHPVAPVSRKQVRRRNAQILAFARYAASTAGPLVMAGDFNVTMWNEGYRPLETLAGLANARKGRGIGPTWPSLWPLGVPIDHVLTSPELRVHDFRVLDSIGSDHRPIAVKFSVCG